MIRVVFDTSALLAYAAGGELSLAADADAATGTAAGELIYEVVSSGYKVGVPVTCLAAAHARTEDPFGEGQLMLLPTAIAINVVPLDDEDAREVGDYTRVYGGDLAMGHAAQVALAHEAYYATMHADWVREAGVLPKRWPIMDLGERF